MASSSGSEGEGPSELTNRAGYGSDSDSWESITDEEDEKAIDINIMAQNSTVLEKVFQYLPLRDLYNCRLVSKCWNLCALRYNILGHQTRITITKNNVDMFLVAMENCKVPFCRNFKFHRLDFDEKIKPLLRKLTNRFKSSITSLTFDCCSAVTCKEIVKLVKHIQLRDLRVIGKLPELNEDNFPEPFLKTVFQYLSNLELASSSPIETVSQKFVETLLCNSENLTKISISGSNDIWKHVVQTIRCSGSRLRSLNFKNMAEELSLDEFEVVSKKTKIAELSFRNCGVTSDFFHGLLGLLKNELEEISISGLQRDILTSTMSSLNCCSLKRATIPNYALSTKDGIYVLRAFPNLELLTISGLLKGVYWFREKQLLTLAITSCTETYPLEPEFAILAQKRQKEFNNIINFCSNQPKRIKIDMTDLHSSGLRKIFTMFPTIEELSILNNSRQCIDGWTGIPSKVCRRIAMCRSFSVVPHETVKKLVSLSTLSDLRKLEITIFDVPPKAEFTLVYIIYAIALCKNLNELRLGNFTLSDLAFHVIKTNCTNLSQFFTDGSTKAWENFLTHPFKNKLKSFLVPPKSVDCNHPLENPKMIFLVLKNLSRIEIFACRLISKKWYHASQSLLHGRCALSTMKLDCEEYWENVELSNNDSSTNAPQKSPRKQVLTNNSAPLPRNFPDVMNFVQNNGISTLILRGLNMSQLEYYQRFGHKQPSKCSDYEKAFYWFFPDGSDYFFVPTSVKITSVTLIGCWARRDTWLFAIFDSPCVSVVVLRGLFQEVLDCVLPKLAQQSAIESITVMPFTFNTVCEIQKHHFHMISTASFSLKHLKMHKLQIPSDVVADTIRAHRFTLETISIQNHVNVSDRLSFEIPNLKELQLDEPPGTLLWSTLTINQTVQSICFERSGYTYNQIKCKSIPKRDSSDEEFQHLASNLLCDVNLFLESLVNRGYGNQKSILQDGSDSALKFFKHFRFLTSLTLRSVHAHYGLPTGIFKNLSCLEKLVFTHTTGITDQILTGLPKCVLEKVDLLNPMRFRFLQEESDYFKAPSIRDMKQLQHLSIDDQHGCTDLSVILGVMSCEKLKYFSCRKWKITDISLRAIADHTSVETMITTGCSGVSKFGLAYFKLKPSPL